MKMRVAIAASAAAAFALIGGTIATTASATPSNTPSCSVVGPGQSSGWCDLTAPGKVAGDSRAQGEVVVGSTGTTLTVNTQDNNQGNGSLGAAPAESEACIYPAPQQPREKRLDSIKSCSAVGGTLVTWSNTNSSGTITIPSSVGTDFFVYVAAHPDSNNSQGTPYHWTFEVVLSSSAAPIGAVGGLGFAGLVGIAFVAGQRRRTRTATAS
jgi:hypothetical protein